MLKSLFLAASLTGLLAVSGRASVAVAADTSGASNIGFVLYSKSYTPGTLFARWMYTSKYKGPGMATGGPKDGFAGRYHVRYFFDSGEFSDRKSTRLNSSHVEISYAVFCLKKKSRPRLCSRSA